MSRGVYVCVRTCVERSARQDAPINRDQTMLTPTSTSTHTHIQKPKTKVQRTGAGEHVDGLLDGRANRDVQLHTLDRRERPVGVLVLGVLCVCVCVDGWMDEIGLKRGGEGLTDIHDAKPARPIQSHQTGKKTKQARSAYRCTSSRRCCSSRPALRDTRHTSAACAYCVHRWEFGVSVLVLCVSVGAHRPIQAYAHTNLHTFNGAGMTGTDANRAGSLIRSNASESWLYPMGACVRATNVPSPPCGL